VTQLSRLNVDSRYADLVLNGPIRSIRIA